MTTSRRLLFKFRLPIIWIAVCVASLFLVISTWLDHGGVADFGILVLNLVVLGITATTLHLTIPEPARLWVDRQVELGIDDLIFYLYEEGDSAQKIPRDILLQLHVAVSNVGGRKAVLSKLELLDFLDAEKSPVKIGLVPVTAMQYSVRDHRVTTIAVLRGQQNNLERYSASEEFPGPFVLAPDDVITLRLRARGGIAWTEQWNLEALESLAAGMDREIRYARLKATYRRSDELMTQTFEVSLQVLQQSMYLEALKLITKDFAERPDVSPLVVPDF